MKIAVFSDLQGFSYESWKRLVDEGLPEDVECVLTLGDIDVFDLKILKERLSDNIPWIGVHGNHDYIGDLEYLSIENLHAKTKTVKNHVFGGLKGSIRYKKGNSPMLTQSEAKSVLGKMHACDVLISHNSPIGVHDKKDLAHGGFRGLLTYIEKHQPKYAFHGHQHVNKETMIGETKVVSIYGGWVFDLKTGDKQEILMMED